MANQTIDPKKLIDVITKLEKALNETSRLALSAKGSALACEAYISRIPGASEVDVEKLLADYGKMAGLVSSATAPIHAEARSAIRRIHQKSQNQIP